ncbi:uncharacterized protein [Apostichopus japonicus]|uniref:uncharacterized protein isoform X2 n=1 Tax=Stichopus japonicus TaxID=307972 RepID=UPI003AB426F1
MTDRHHKVTSITLKWEDRFDEVAKLQEKEGIKEKTTRMLTSRRNRGCGQSVFVALVLVTLVYGCYLYFDLKKSLEETRDRAVRYQQQQESLTGQLQVVYEHRTRLEKNLKDSKSETKRAKEDAQRTIELEKQEANNKYNALNIQHKMLKSQNDDIKEELEDALQRERKAVEEKEKMLYELQTNTTQLKESCDEKQQLLTGQLETLKAENELGQQYFLQLREAKQQIDQANQDKSILTDRLIENEQLISANEKEKVFLQNQVETFSRQVQSLKMQLEHANSQQQNLVPDIPLNNVPNMPQNNNQLPEVQKIIDPYEQQRIAFDKQRQQELLEKRYVQQQNVNQVNGVDARYVQQPQQVPQQPQQQIIQQQPAQNDIVMGGFKQNVQPAPISNNNQPGAKDIDRNVNLHLDQADTKEKAEEKGDSDYEDSDGEQQGVVLKDPGLAAQETRQLLRHSFHQDRLKIIRERQERIVRLKQKYHKIMEDQDGDGPNVREEEKDRLPDAKKPNEQAEEDSAKEQKEDGKDEDEGDEPLWQKANEREKDEDEKMQALQEKQLEEDLRREEKAEEDDNMALHPPGNYEAENDRDEDAPGLVIDVRRDEVEEHIEEAEGLQKQQQLQARVQGAGEEDKDEESNIDDNKPEDSDSPNDQREFVAKDEDPGEEDVVQNPDVGEDEQHQGLDRPEIDDAQMNDVINNPPVLDHPAKEESNEDDKQDKIKFNQEMR